MHFLLFSLQWKCHLSKASCYRVFPMPNTWPLRRGFYLYIFSDLYFSFKELHALRHLKRSQHKEVRLHGMPPTRTTKNPGPGAGAAPSNSRSSRQFTSSSGSNYYPCSWLGPHPPRSRAPTKRRRRRLPAQPAPLPGACQPARCCHSLASGAWKSNCGLRLAANPDPDD